jgi:nucleoid-associated protein YgaU
MSLQQKYQPLIQKATSAGVQNLQVREDGRVLKISGQAPSENVKKQIWDEYNRIDPGYRTADLVLDISLAEGATQEYEVKPGDSLSKIGQNFGVSWKEIYEANKNIIKNPDVIQPGWKLKVPAKG